MKNILLILVLIIFSIGKTYCQSIIDHEKNKLWYVLSGGISYNGVENDTCCLESEVFKLGDDVTLNDKTYSQIYKSEESTITDWELIGYLREDSKKVYYVPLSQGVEFLLYDFNIELSEKIYITNPLYGNSYSIEYTVSKLDSVELGSVKRKRITLSGSQQEIWIEGIGSLNGLIYSGLLIDGGFKNLTCYYENENNIYDNPDYDYCFYVPTSIINKKNNVIIYPNPTNGLITLNNLKNATFYLYNLTSELVLKKNINNDIYMLDVSEQNSGFYLYRIQQDNSFIQGKLILKHE